MGWVFICYKIIIDIGNACLATSSAQFKLQYKEGTDGSCTTDSWTDVGAGGGASIWRYATSSVTDGSAITKSLTTSDISEVYAKSNPTVTNPISAKTNQSIEYDFHIEHNSATPATMYSFRVIKSDETVFSGYTNCPSLHTMPTTDNLMRHGKFFSGGALQGYFWAD